MSEREEDKSVKSPEKGKEPKTQSAPSDTPEEQGAGQPIPRSDSEVQT